MIWWVICPQEEYDGLYLGDLAEVVMPEDLNEVLKACQEFGVTGDPHLAFVVWWGSWSPDDGEERGYVTDGLRKLCHSILRDGGVLKSPSVLCEVRGCGNEHQAV